MRVLPLLFVFFATAASLLVATEVELPHSPESLIGQRDQNAAAPDHTARGRKVADSGTGGSPVAVNRSDPLTGAAVDAKFGTIFIDIENRDPAARGSSRTVCIGFASPESWETVSMADAPTKQKYARAALANKTITGRPVMVR